jgi:ABC-type hemin transport system substrate-binding protein
MSICPESSLRRAVVAAALAVCGLGVAQAQAPAAPHRAEVIHWWTSGGESAAVKTLSDAYRAAGGTWVDMAVALGEQARAVAINRIVGGNPPTAAQFNTSKQFLDVVEQGMLNNVDEVALRVGQVAAIRELAEAAEHCRLRLHAAVHEVQALADRLDVGLHQALRAAHKGR